MMESLTAAMQTNIVPDQEYLLQGSILDSKVDVLNHRLRGLCDNVDGKESFNEKEMVFSIRGWYGDRGGSETVAVQGRPHNR